MKVTVDIDCTPKEARAFLGLPDVRATQDAVTAALRDRMMAGLASMEPEAMLKTWRALGLEGLEQMQKAFRAQFGGGPRG
ncbi:MAG: hypothetical protein FJX53_12295 [Alphaproteobacteria bacterium]|nr:hypothetical protein [Alphaproteobacteria bacterium]